MEGTQGKRGVNRASWRGIATDDLADTDDHPCNSEAIYHCVATLLILYVIPSATSVAIKPRAEIACKLCRGGATKRNSGISSPTAHYKRCRLSALWRFFTNVQNDTLGATLLILALSSVPYVSYVPSRSNGVRSERLRRSLRSGALRDERD